jgi:hypothetical protein
MRILLGIMVTLWVVALSACEPSDGEFVVSSTITTSAPTPTVTTVVPTTVAAPSVSSVEATTTTTTVEPLPPLQGVALEFVTEGLDQPVFVLPQPGTDRLLVVEREGVVQVVGRDGVVQDAPYLDLSSVIGSSSIEQGLLGMAFHPGNPERVFVYYTLPSNTSVLAEIPIVDGEPAVAEIIELLRFEQPTERHNAGMIEFGPDGYLFLALGEGGAAGTHAQDPNTLLSSILRLDLDRGEPYAVPADNPFAGGGGAPEVWAYGLRNPWRFSIDPLERLVYIGDVGHSDWEEIDVVSLDGGGFNFGWASMEGTHCFSTSDCDTAGLELPVLEYPHSDGCSVTGGYVYRGAAIPELTGHYFYGDWCSGFIRSFRFENGAVFDEHDWTEELGFSGQVNSFGVDAEGELLIATWEGTIYRLVPLR